jgi:CheY-like chemotaxis protein
MTQQRAILVVDDDPDILKTLCVVLERNGYAVKSAASGREARKVLESWRPDLVILDIIMETDMEGLEVAKDIRNNPGLAGIPIFMLTSFLEKLRWEGAEKFPGLFGEEWPAQWLFEKPLDTKKLLLKIQAVLTEQ